MFREKQESLKITLLIVICVVTCYVNGCGIHYNQSEIEKEETISEIAWAQNADGTYTFKNNMGNSESKYAWYIMDENNNVIEKIMYTESPILTYDICSNDEAAIIKGFVRNYSGETYEQSSYRINIKEIINSKNDEMNDNSLDIIFTVDVEDKRKNVPYLIEGDLSEYGINQNCGMNYIMDTFEKKGYRAVFFVNIYEHNQYDSDYMPELLNRINERGHEVALHCHPPYDGSLPFYKEELTNYNYDEQYNIISYGVRYIEQAIGKTPVAFRAGGYRVTDETYKAILDNGIKIDSSIWYGNLSNKIKDFTTKKNQVFEEGGLIEFPVITVFDSNGWCKLDIDNMSEESIISVFEEAKKSEKYNAIQIMFHSFTFLDQSGTDAGNNIIIEDDPYEMTKYIRGEDTADKEKLENILAYLYNNEGYNVITFEDYLNKSIEIPEYDDDNIFYLNDRNIAFRRENVHLDIQGEKICLDNDFKSDSSKLQYCWVIVNIDDTSEKYESGYSNNSSYDFGITNAMNGTYNIKSYIKDSFGNKVRGIYYRIYIENGKVINLEEL